MKILIIDRVKLFKQIIASVLDETEIRYEFADTGQGALQKLQSEAFQFICVSMYLDDMDAVTFCQHVRKLPDYYFTPIIMITSEDSSGALKHAMQVGVTDFFQKKDCGQLVNFIRRFGHHDKQLQGRVLYIEDNKSQRLALRALLEQHGLTVDDYADAEQAFEAFNEHYYDLVITDIILDGSMSGVSLANRIRRLEGIKGDTPILALTAYDNTARRIGLFYLGVDDYIAKPVLEEELFSRVRSLINSFKLLQKNQQSLLQAHQCNIAKNAFLLLMAYELQTPAQNIVDQVACLQADRLIEQLPSQVTSSIQHIATNGKQMLHVLDEILAMVNVMPTALAIHRVEFNRVVTETLDLIQKSANKFKIQLSYKPLDELVYVNADELFMKQGLLALLFYLISEMGDKASLLMSSQRLNDEHVVLTLRIAGSCLTESQTQVLLESIKPSNASTSFNQLNKLSFMPLRILSEMGGQFVLKNKSSEGAMIKMSWPLVA